MYLLLFSLYLDDIFGQLFSFFVLTVAAAESSIGLAIIILYYKNRGNIFYSNKFLLKS
jgi:NADH-quinone oxidoreductase subunit K